MLAVPASAIDDELARLRARKKPPKSAIARLDRLREQAVEVVEVARLGKGGIVEASGIGRGGLAERLGGRLVDRFADRLAGAQR